MGRQVRMVPPDWQHPEDRRNEYRPLLSGYAAHKEEWLESLQMRGYEETVARCGRSPDPLDYMPEFAPGTATHYMMYEDTTEGTPISPAFATPEELARWLADNNASAFARNTATYEQWMAMIVRGWVPSAAIINGEIRSGVEAAADTPPTT